MSEKREVERDCRLAFFTGGYGTFGWIILLAVRRTEPAMGKEEVINTLF